VVDQIVYLLRRCRNLGASNRTPVQTKTRQIHYGQVCRNVERELCERQEKATLLLSLPSFLSVIIGYNKSIVL
jgi:hypothetical protein